MSEQFHDRSETHLSPSQNVEKVDNQGINPLAVTELLVAKAEIYHRLLATFF